MTSILLVYDSVDSRMGEQQKHGEAFCNYFCKIAAEVCEEATFRVSSFCHGHRLSLFQGVNWRQFGEPLGSIFRKVSKGDFCGIIGIGPVSCMALQVMKTGNAFDGNKFDDTFLSTWKVPKEKPIHFYSSVAKAFILQVPFLENNMLESLQACSMQLRFFLNSCTKKIKREPHQYAVSIKNGFQTNFGHTVCKPLQYHEEPFEKTKDLFDKEIKPGFLFSEKETVEFKERLLLCFIYDAFDVDEKTVGLCCVDKHGTPFCLLVNDVRLDAWKKTSYPTNILNEYWFNEIEETKHYNFNIEQASLLMRNVRPKLTQSNLSLLNYFVLKCGVALFSWNVIPIVPSEITKNCVLKVNFDACGKNTKILPNSIDSVIKESCLLRSEIFKKATIGFLKRERKNKADVNYCTGLFLYDHKKESLHIFSTHNLVLSNNENAVSFYHFKDTVSMLNKFLSVFMSIDPFVVICDDFASFMQHVNVINACAEMPGNVNRTFNTFNVSCTSDGIVGRILVDFNRLLYDKNFLDKYKCCTVAELMCKELNLSPVEVLDMYDKLTLQEMVMIADNLTESVNRFVQLMSQLVSKLDIIPSLFEYLRFLSISNQTCYVTESSLNSLYCVMAVCEQRHFKHRIPLWYPNQYEQRKRTFDEMEHPEKKKKRFEGGLVLKNEEKTQFKNVAFFDFSSFYPSIIIGLAEAGKLDFNPKLIEIFKQLVEWKKYFKPAKLIVNKFYGLLALLCPTSAALVTKIGRVLIEAAYKWMEQNCDGKMVFVDTDGFALEVDNADSDDLKKKCEMFIDEITKYDPVYSHLHLVFEKKTPLMLMRKKKNYVYQTENGQTVVSKGLPELKRTYNFIQRYCFFKWIECHMTNGNFEETKKHLHDVVNGIRNGSPLFISIYQHNDSKHFTHARIKLCTAGGDKTEDEIDYVNNIFGVRFFPDVSPTMKYVNDLLATEWNSFLAPQKSDDGKGEHVNNH